MKTGRLFTFTMIWLSTIVFLNITSCGYTKSVEPAELEGTWVLKTMNGEKANDLFEQAVPTIQFDFDKMMVYGTGGCNSYRGDFTFKNNIFSAPNLAVTRMLCIGKNEEGNFLSELGKENTLSLEDGILRFSGNGNMAVLEFERINP